METKQASLSNPRYEPLADDSGADLLPQGMFPLSPKDTGHDNESWRHGAFRSTKLNREAQGQQEQINRRVRYNSQRIVQPSIQKSSSWQRGTS